MSYRYILSAVVVSFLSSCGGSSGSKDTLAVDDNFDLASKGLVSIEAQDGVLKNDDGEGLVAELLSEPSNASGFVFNADGSFSYTAESDTVFTDQFQYQITGSDDIVSTAIATIKIYPQPQATADEYRMYLGQANNVAVADGVLANDDTNRNDSNAIVKTGPTQADAFTLNADGSFSYTPKAGASGTDHFSYTIQDDLQSSEAQTVELIIDTGIFSGADDSFDVVSGKILNLQPLQGLLKNDNGLVDATVAVQKLPLHAIDFSLSSEGELVYRTVSETTSADSFSYTLQKDQNVIGPFEVSINISQPTDLAVAPWLYDQCTEYDAGDVVNGYLSGVDIDSASFELVSAPRFGTLTSFDGATGQYSYVRNTNNRGQDAFSYRLLDSDGAYIADATQELIAVPYRIMPVGDSITSGVEFYDSSINSDTPASNIRIGYRKYLKDELSALGYTVDLVGSRSEGYNVSGFSDSQHNGYPGVSDTYVSDNMTQWLDTSGADVVLMHIGTNGTKSHLDHIRAIGTKMDAWEAREDNPVTWMLSKLIARTDYTSNANAILNFNGLIENYVDERIDAGDRIHLVDQYSALGASGRYLSDDHLHPGLDGYKLMSQEWIKRLLETQAISKCF